MCVAALKQCIDFKWKWSEDDIHALEHNTYLMTTFCFWINESFRLCPWSTASWVVMWRGSFGTEHATGPRGGAVSLQHMISLREVPMTESLLISLAPLHSSVPKPSCAGMDFFLLELWCFTSCFYILFQNCSTERSLQKSIVIIELYVDFQSSHRIGASNCADPKPR